MRRQEGNAMIEIFWGCLIAGALFAIVSLVAGDLFHHGLDGISDAFSFDHLDFLHPTTIASAVTTFGGIGVLLSRYTSLDTFAMLSVTVTASLVIAVALHFLYVKPMRNSENSVGFSMAEFSGQVGRITIPIPAKGYGEVMIRMGAGNSCQVASSHDGDFIPAGTEVVVVDVVENVLYVSRFDQQSLPHADERQRLQ
jgi:membrane protein implicated in regulation of membrane protease activity